MLGKRSRSLISHVTDTTEVPSTDECLRAAEQTARRCHGTTSQSRQRAAATKPQTNYRMSGAEAACNYPAGIRKRVWTHGERRLIDKSVTPPSRETTVSLITGSRRVRPAALLTASCTVRRSTSKHCNGNCRRRGQRSQGNGEVTETTTADFLFIFNICHQH